MSSKSPLNGSLERLEIKNRMEIDTVNIGQPGAKIDTKTTTNLSYMSYGNSRNLTNKLPTYVDANIKATHFEIGPGGLA
jgi:hypothetical protein